VPDIPLNQYPLNTPIGRTKKGEEVFIDHRYHRFFFELIRRLGGPSNFVISDIAGLTLADGAFLVGDGTTVVPESGATARTSIGLGTTDSPQFTGLEIGHASDTTLTRASAGNLAVEGNALYRAGGTDVALGDGGTGASLADPGGDRILFWDDSAGAVTWLTAGSNLTITGTSIAASGGGGGVDTGTSFPGTPAEDDLFYRTDLNLFCFYDGTRWLTVNQYVIPLTNSSQFSTGKTLSTASMMTGVAALAPTYDFWMETFYWSSQVITTNNGTNYWDVKLTKYTTTTQATIVTGSTGTAPDTAGDIVSHATTVGALLGSSADIFAVDITKVLSPGAFTLHGATVVGRPVIT
jgi:hypothetical protein